MSAKTILESVGRICLLALAFPAARGSVSNVLGKREILVDGYASYGPIFAAETKTLDPALVARECWNGYLVKQPDPWGLTRDLKPTLRFHFDNRALPWPSLKHHSVDGPDNNARNVGAHALLHAMFGPEKDNDPAEAGEIAYLLSCTDPESGLAYSPDNLPRECALAEGELARNVLLLYEQTRDPALLAWAQKMLKSLREGAAVYERPGIGQVAAYKHGNLEDSPSAEGAQDPTLGGWQHLFDGWDAGAFAEYYRVTGDRNALDFAAALENRLCNSEDPNGDDGSFRPDGSFGGKLKHKAIGHDGSWHMHGHTHCLLGLVTVGEQLVALGQRDRGLAFIEQARRTMDWLYDPTRNPDAGSMTGWLGEFLNSAAGWTTKADCEGCTMGDVTQTACALGAASRLDPSLADLEDFYDRAEQIYSGELIEQKFCLKPAYLDVVRECLTKHVDKEMPSAAAGVRTEEVSRRYDEALKTAARMVGQQLGICGFPDWVNHLVSNLDPDLPGIHMQGCCSDATIRASFAIWSQTITGDENETRINLSFNRDSELARVVSCLPHRGEVDILVKHARRVLVRIPGWAPKSETKVFIDRMPTAVSWNHNYVVLSDLLPGEQITVTYPLRIAKVTEPIQGTVYTERWRGNTIVDVDPPGKWIPMFKRPELEDERVPE